MRQALKTHRGLAVWVVVTALTLAASLALIGISVRQSVNYQRKTDRIVCRAINRFDGVVVGTLERSRANLPKLAYFQAHPGELAAQLAEIRRQIRLFAPTHCR